MVFQRKPGGFFLVFEEEVFLEKKNRGKGESRGRLKKRRPVEEERGFSGRKGNQTEEAPLGAVSFHFLTPTSPFDKICMMSHCLLWTSKATGLVLG